MHHNLIAGEWLAGTGLRRNINPSDTSDLVGEYAHADAVQTERAIQAARQAFPAWSRGSVQARADALEKIAAELLARKDELGNLLAREEGKTLPEAVGEVARAGQIDCAARLLPSCNPAHRPRVATSQGFRGIDGFPPGWRPGSAWSVRGTPRAGWPRRTPWPCSAPGSTGRR